jgi:hypothetical protein
MLPVLYLLLGLLIFGALFALTHAVDSGPRGTDRR